VQRRRNDELRAANNFSDQTGREPFTAQKYTAFQLREPFRAIAVAPAYRQNNGIDAPIDPSSHSIVERKLPTAALA